MARSHFLAPLLKASSGGRQLVNPARGTVVAEEVEGAFDSATRRRGLLGRDGLDEGTAIVIAPSNGVHTFFMRFPIDIVFAKRDGTVVKACRAVRPWRLAIALRGFAVIEGAPGMIDRSRTEVGDVLAVR